MKKSPAGQFRNTVWDPALIMSQIIAVQTVFYTSYGLLTFIVCYMSSKPVSVAQMFDANVSSLCFLFLVLIM